MRAAIRRLHSPDIDDLARYQPTEPDRFGFLLQIFVGPENGPGEESFDVVVCTPLWILDRYSREEIVEGRHMLVVFEYNYRRLEEFINAKVAHAVGATWEDVAMLLSRLGRWEFEDYVPAP
jgi:hypothetical protein